MILILRLLGEKWLMKILFTRKHFITLISIALMMSLWQIAAWYFDSDLIVPYPHKSFISVVGLIGDVGFIKVVGATVIRGLFGFFISAALGLLVGIWAGLRQDFNTFISPFLVTIRSIPVISLILLALIWFNPSVVPVFIAMLTMFPFICTNVADGIKSVDPNLVQMAKFYRVDRRKILHDLYIPAIMPFIVSGASSAMGIGWRAIIIGEVLSQPRYGIGTKMQAAQTYLNVEAVIAWTLIAILISFAFEKIIRLYEKRVLKWRVQ